MAASKETTKPTEIKVCTCKHKAQDEIHGPQNRVHNPTAKGLKCTVCGHTKPYR